MPFNLFEGQRLPVGWQSILYLFSRKPPHINHRLRLAVNRREAHQKEDYEEIEKW